MKKILIPIIACGFFLNSCNSTESEKNSSLVAKSEENASQPSEQEESEPINEIEYGINLWGKNSIYDLPQKVKGRKWLKSLSYGRKMEIIGDTTIEKKQSYKVKLSEGSIGWINAYTVAKDAKIAVVTGTPKIYSDPDPLALSDNNLSTGDLIAVYNEKVDKYYEFSSKEKKTKGYIKGGNNISFEEIDLEAGIVYTKASNTKDLQEQIKKLEVFLENDEYKTSVFYKKANKKLANISTLEVPEMDDAELESIENKIQGSIENASESIENELGIE